MLVYIYKYKIEIPNLLILTEGMITEIYLDSSHQWFLHVETAHHLPCKGSFCHPSYLAAFYQPTFHMKVHTHLGLGVYSGPLPFSPIVP
jgi:hypothetical protein